LLLSSLFWSAACQYSILSPHDTPIDLLFSIVLISVIRLIVLIKLDLSDVSWGILPLAVWTAIEIWMSVPYFQFVEHGLIMTSSAIVCACLPCLRPLINLIAGKAANWTEISRHDNKYAAPKGTITKHTITSRTVQRNNWPKGKHQEDSATLVEGEEESYEQHGITSHIIGGGKSNDTFDHHDVPLTPMDYSSAKQASASTSPC
jgi:hypothetical protein